MSTKTTSIYDHEILLNDPENDFLKIAETLTRIGIHVPDYGDALVQICYILHKRGKYFIVHESELIQLDDGKSEEELLIDSYDHEQRLKIINLLTQWNMCTPVKKIQHIKDMHGLKVVPYAEKPIWSCISLCDIGKFKVDNAIAV